MVAIESVVIKIQSSTVEVYVIDENISVIYPRSIADQLSNIE